MTEYFLTMAASALAGVVLALAMIAFEGWRIERRIKRRAAHERERLRQFTAWVRGDLGCNGTPIGTDWRDEHGLAANAWRAVAEAKRKRGDSDG